MHLQLFRLYHNEREIDEVAEEHQKKTNYMEKEGRKRDRIEEEVKEKKKEQGRVTRELTKIEQQIKESVWGFLTIKKFFEINLTCIKLCANICLAYTVIPPNNSHPKIQSLFGKVFI